jgi:hypothetical protein
MLFRVRKIVNTYIICTRNGVILRFNKRLKKWTVCQGCKREDGYLTMGIDGNQYLMHRIVAHIYDILDLHDELKIDHIDLNRTNNCISNLRPATVQQNSFNTKAKGYCWKKHAKKWEARICLNGKTIHLGYFDKEEDAKNAYLKAKPIYHVL